MQPDPVGDLYKLRQAEDDVLQTYGWVDKNAGIVRIPISRALALAAERGLPNVQSPLANSQQAASPQQPSQPLPYQNEGTPQHGQTPSGGR